MCVCVCVCVCVRERERERERVSYTYAASQICEIKIHQDSTCRCKSAEDMNNSDKDMYRRIIHRLAI